MTCIVIWIKITFFILFFKKISVQNQRRKVILLGDFGVGKSSIFSRYLDIPYDPTSNITSYGTKRITVNDKEITLMLFDTSGQEAYRSIAPLYFMGSYGAIIVYDVTNTRSFENASNWINKTKEMWNNNIPMILVGNKCDLISSVEISTQNGKSLADQYDIPFIEVSAIENTNIEQIFSILFGNERWVIYFIYSISIKR